MLSIEEYASSDEEEYLSGRTTSNVFLGFADELIDYEDGDDEPTLEDTFIGGKPIWLHPESRPSDSLISCENCGKKMALLLQAFAPLDGKLYDRVLYIFACKNTAQCSYKKGTIKCVRGVSKDPKRVEMIEQQLEDQVNDELQKKLQLENTKKLHIELTKDIFTNNNEKDGSALQNPFGGLNPFDLSNPFGCQNPFGSESATSNLKTPQAASLESSLEPSLEHSQEQKSAPNPKNSQQANIAFVSDDSLPSYPGYFVYIEKEKLKKEPVDSDLAKYKHLIDAAADDDHADLGNSNLSSSKLNPQATKISNMLDDSFFEAFSNTVKHNSSQVLRYDLGGTPLLYSGRDDVAKRFVSSKSLFNIPKPHYKPSSCRQFELQLMPKAILDLSVNANANGSAETKDILNGMSWGTIIVCTDTEDYIPPQSFDSNSVAYIEEWCGVQWEESI